MFDRWWPQLSPSLIDRSRSHRVSLGLQDGLDVATGLFQNRAAYLPGCHRDGSD